MKVFLPICVAKDESEEAALLDVGGGPQSLEEGLFAGAIAVHAGIMDTVLTTCVVTRSRQDLNNLKVFLHADVIADVATEDATLAMHVHRLVTDLSCLSKS